MLEVRTDKCQRLDHNGRQFGLNERRSQGLALGRRHRSGVIEVIADYHHVQRAADLLIVLGLWLKADDVVDVLRKVLEGGENSARIRTNPGERASWAHATGGARGNLHTDEAAAREVLFKCVPVCVLLLC